MTTEQFQSTVDLMIKELKLLKKYNDVEEKHVRNSASDKAIKIAYDMISFIEWDNRSWYEINITKDTVRQFKFWAKKLNKIADEYEKKLK